jgi:hypothetical protein
MKATAFQAQLTFRLVGHAFFHKFSAGQDHMADLSNQVSIIESVIDSPFAASYVPLCY